MEIRKTTILFWGGIMITFIVFIERLPVKAKKQIEIRDSLLIENYKLRNELLKKQLKK